MCSPPAAVHLRDRIYNSSNRIILCRRGDAEEEAALARAQTETAQAEFWRSQQQGAQHVPQPEAGAGGPGRYRLLAAVNHDGQSIHEGHYVAVIRDRGEKRLSAAWMRTNQGNEICHFRLPADKGSAGSFCPCCRDWRVAPVQ